MLVLILIAVTLVPDTSWCDDMTKAGHITDQYIMECLGSMPDA